MTIGYMDEVGKGSWFGPLVVCMIICDDDDYLKLLGVKDSKKLSPKKRESIYKSLVSNKESVFYSLGVVSNKFIDTYGIEPATSEAYKRAYWNLSKIVLIPPLSVVMDGNWNYLRGIQGVQVSNIVKGDDKVVQIGAASIIAKVYRDHMISELSKKYSGYDLESNKGYGTQKHIDAIGRLGITKLHRKSFIKSYRYE